MDVKEIRNSLHQIPELGRKEYKTKEFIKNLAKNLNCKIYEVTNTGIVLFFNANKNDTICFRSDMDALPILEKNEVSYKSKNIGVMHACGHDGHMAMLLSYAIWASNNIDKLKHNIVCLFEPSEEDNAGANDIRKSTYSYRKILLATLFILPMIGIVSSKYLLYPDLYAFIASFYVLVYNEKYA